MADERLETLARRVLEARADYEKKHKVKVSAEKAKAKAEAELADTMEKQKLPSIKIELGDPWGTQEFGRRKKTLSSVFDKEAFIKWCKENHHETAYLGSEPRKAPLNALVKEYDENGQELPPGVEPRITKYVQVTQR
jgi:hypothetical protein